MKVLSFGHIPSWAGGRQETGLANVIYQLAKFGSEINGTEVTLAATDVNNLIIQDGKLLIIGWTKASLIKEILKHPLRSVRSFFKLVDLKKKYPRNERFLGLYLKRIFLDASLRNIKPDMVHLHGPNAIWYIDLVPEKSKLAVTFHGMCGSDFNIEQYEVLYKMERDIVHSPEVDGLFYICSQLAIDFKQAYGENNIKNTVIFNSYDNKSFYFDKEYYSKRKTERDNDKIVLCTLATLSDRKGQARVISGIKDSINRDEFLYIAIGGGSEGYSTSLIEYASGCGVRFDYLGKMRPDAIRKKLYDVDYMIMPSSSEGFGLTYLEAIACGVPVILPKNLPIAQEKGLINEKNSILLDDCSPESIAKVLIKIKGYDFNHEEVANTITNISWDMIAHQYYNEFKNLIN